MDLTANEYANFHCIYQHSMALPEIAGTPAGRVVFYVGVCKLSELHLSPDARCNTEWQRLITPNVRYAIELVEVGENPHKLFQSRQGLINALKPHCNIKGYHSEGARRMIVHKATGARYVSQSDVARVYQLSQSQLSKHLRGMPGHISIKGHQFRYYDPEIDGRAPPETGHATPPDVTGIGRAPFGESGEQ